MTVLHTGSVVSISGVVVATAHSVHANDEHMVDRKDSSACCVNNTVTANGDHPSYPFCIHSIHEFVLIEPIIIIHKRISHYGY